MTKVIRNISLDSELWEQAKKDHKSVAGLLNTLLTNYLEAQKGNQQKSTKEILTRQLELLSPKLIEIEAQINNIKVQLRGIEEIERDEELKKLEKEQKEQINTSLSNNCIICKEDKTEIGYSVMEDGSKICLHCTKNGGFDTYFKWKAERKI